MKTDAKGQALPIGRILRILLGLFFIYEIHDVYLDVDLDGIIIRLSWAVGLVVFYWLLHLTVGKLKSDVNQLLGFFIAWVPVVAVFGIGYGGPAATGALTFLSLTLILAGIRADPGCEVMSFPAILSGKHTHLLCPLFSPLDWMEKSWSRAK